MSPAKKVILEEFGLFIGNEPGIESWLSERTADEVFDRLAVIDREPLSKGQFNQLLILAHEASMSDGFFTYYWLTNPSEYHPYDTTKLPGYNSNFIGSDNIISKDHLQWGLYRLYVDSLLFFGNIRQGFRELRSRDFDWITSFFHEKRFRPDTMARRGSHLPLQPIARDDRYVIAEVACKTYGTEDANALEGYLEERYSNKHNLFSGTLTFKDLLFDELSSERDSRQHNFAFAKDAIDEVINEPIGQIDDISAKIGPIRTRFIKARATALQNTCLYLSMVNDLDVYVATSMRTRDDFRKMVEFCEYVFLNSRLNRFHLRYFDPTLSAASGHEDKGLIECLMVKCAKILLLFAGEKDSYGKDAEAAMALSLGRPVIFYCDAETRSQFYRDVHPLSRLIDFSNGVAVGAIVTDRESQVVELIDRIINNSMQYELLQPRPGHFQLKEALSGSIVRLQTADVLLRETFWNHYHPQR